MELYCYSYLAMDKYGKYGIVSIYNIGANVTLCDSHISSNVILSVCDPQVRSTSIGNVSKELPDDGVVIVQVFDITTVLVNHKPITMKKIATTTLNVSSFDG